MSSLQPILLHGHPGPNPWKVALLLSELDIPYTTKIYTTPELKQPDFLKINPNGMAPVIEDPNTGLKLAESGAIMDYIISQYDKENKLSFTNLNDKWHMQQWLQLQTTSQGPILQRIFRYSFTEPNAAARASSVKDLHHVLKLLDDELRGKEWLVGGKCSAADLSFVAFHDRIGAIAGDDAPDMGKEYPAVEAWYGRVAEREAVRKVTGERDEALKKVTFPGKR